MGVVETRHRDNDDDDAKLREHDLVEDDEGPLEAAGQASELLVLFLGLFEQHLVDAERQAEEGYCHIEYVVTTEARVQHQELQDLDA